MWSQRIRKCYKKNFGDCISSSIPANISKLRILKRVERTWNIKGKERKNNIILCSKLVHIFMFIQYKKFINIWLFYLAYKVNRKNIILNKFLLSIIRIRGMQLPINRWNCLSLPVWTLKQRYYNQRVVEGAWLFYLLLYP